ncbi:kinase-like domain-containing protein [Irpex lacteus]|nr:kinase-like domain-containing protein [Irpex lacteus]
MLHSLKTPLDEELRIITNVDTALARAGTKILAVLDWLKQRMSTALASLCLSYRLWKAIASHVVDLEGTAVYLDWHASSRLPDSWHQVLCMVSSSPITRYTLAAPVIVGLLGGVLYISLFVSVIWMAYYTRIEFVDQAAPETGRIVRPQATYASDLSAGVTPTQEVDGSIDTHHSIPVDTQPPTTNTVDPDLGVSGDEAETPSTISESANQAVSLSSAVLDISPDLTAQRAAEPVDASNVHVGHAVPIREVEDEVDDDASQVIVSTNPLRRASDSSNGRPASESNNRGTSQESPNQHKSTDISEVSASRAIDRAPSREHTTNTLPKTVEDLPTIEAKALCDRFPDNYHIQPAFYAKYELEKLLGAGAHGFVIEARRRQDGREVAVKFVQTADDSRIGRPWRNHPIHGRVPYEVVVMHAIVHDNVIGLIEVFRDDTYVYVVQELHGTLWNPIYEDGEQIYPDGNRSLLAYIWQNGPMPASDAKYVFKQLVAAVRFCHARGLSHCDIKPENMVIDDNLKLKLIDFGGSLRSTELPRPWYTNPRVYGGTRVYNAPELHKGEQFQPEKADSYAMGAVLYEMLTGERAFQDEASITKGLLNYNPETTSNVEGLNSLWPLMEGCFEGKRWSADRLSKHPLLQ